MINKSKKILFLSPYAVVPPRYGGPLRVYNICYQLAQHYYVSQFAQQAQRQDVSWTTMPLIKQVTPNYIEYSSRNPLSLLLYALTSLKWNCPPIWQQTMLKFFAPQWLKRQIFEADLIHVESPWQFRWAYQNVGTRKPIVLSAQNVESMLYNMKQITAPPVIARHVMQSIEYQERFALQHASHVLTTSDDDTFALTQRYNISSSRCTIIPNGVDCKVFMPVSSTKRLQRKAELGLQKKVVILFAGSLHHPNVEAVNQIIHWAKQWSNDQVVFLVVGTVGRAFMNVQHPGLYFTGSVKLTQPFFEAADIAINPMLSGSGTNLKQFEFMAMGLPTVATPLGVRGIPVIDGVHGYVRQLDEFLSQLQAMIDNPEPQYQIGLQGRTFVEQRFDWSIIGQSLIQIYERLLDQYKESTQLEH